ncbi:hypothetical protein GCM10020221_23380 [Streptomyces thioluteus]|uniref:Uncharacterized protein n=1 Tax=Streptomyces thioluteus TaxID=66431 RepID=A0ABN3WUA4_STRTU
MTCSTSSSAPDASSGHNRYPRLPATSNPSGPVVSDINAPTYSDCDVNLPGIKVAIQTSGTWERLHAERQRFKGSGRAKTVRRMRGDGSVRHAEMRQE